MVSERFTRRLVVRIAALATTALVIGLAASAGLVAVATIAGAAAIVQIALLARAVDRTHRELTRLVDGLRYDDYQQAFALRPMGASFAALQTAFDQALARFRDARMEREAERRYLEAVVEHVPIAIIAVHGDGAIELKNSAARRLFDRAAATHVDRLIDYGALFQRDVAQATRDARVVTRMDVDGAPRQLMLSTTQISVGGDVIRLIALQDIQRELDGAALATWHDMARILSHEILNSLTPIASLARTADERVAELAARGPDETVEDLVDATRTIARRADGLMRFVKSYRQFTQMPPPSLRPLELRAYLERVAALLRGELANRGVALHVEAPPLGLAVMADDALLDQALINVVHNAAHAAAAASAPQVWLSASLSERGRPVIEIADNGPGVDAALGDKIYLPFFTTKTDGSGIGLALARQVMLVHEGGITAGTRPGGGALFRLSF
ncbi:MAG TPA: ATP-binding protein [Kofleriaceae bacterium]|nr:ATP-binding protein [Kofleriaceae bacterium]